MQDTTAPHEPRAEHASARAGRVADLLLDIGTVLLVSGAHSGRLRRNVERVAESWDYHLELFITFTGLMVTITNKHDYLERASRFRRAPLHGVHFDILTEASLLTWAVVEEKLEIDEVEKRWQQIKKLPHTPRWMILAGIGAACGCLCLLQQGSDWKNACIAFVAAVAGMFVRQEILKMRFNPMIAFISASFVTTLIAGMDMLHHIGASPEKTLATSVLYLIPGVPLINCTIDLIEGHIPTAIARGVYGGFILLCIAVGMSLSIILLGIHNF